MNCVAQSRLARLNNSIFGMSIIFRVHKTLKMNLGQSKTLPAWLLVNTLPLKM